MQRKSRLFIANIVLGVVLAVILCISIAVMTMFYGVFREVKQEYEAYSWGYIYDELSEDNSSWDYEYEWDSDTGL